MWSRFYEYRANSDIIWSSNEIITITWDYLLWPSSLVRRMWCWPSWPIVDSATAVKSTVVTVCPSDELVSVVTPSAEDTLVRPEVGTNCQKTCTSLVILKQPRNADYPNARPQDTTGAALSNQQMKKYMNFIRSYSQLPFLGLQPLVLSCRQAKWWLGCSDQPASRW